MIKKPSSIDRVPDLKGSADKITSRKAFWSDPLAWVIAK